MTTTYSTPFMDKPDAGFRLGDIRAIWDAVANLNGYSKAYGIAAAGTTYSNSTQLTSVLNQVDTVAASTGVNLPSSRGSRATPYAFCSVTNNGANTLTVYAFKPASGTADTINGTAGATGVSLGVGSTAVFMSAKPGAWFAAIPGGAATFTTMTATTVNALTALQGPAPVPVGSALTITAAKAGATFLLDTAVASVATLPAATGTGNIYRFVVTATTTTTTGHKILAASSSDFLNGIVTGYTGSTPKMFSSAAATNHSIQMPFTGSQPSGGFIGDYFNFTDVATNLWNVDGMYQAGTTPTTPFSAATS